MNTQRKVLFAAGDVGGARSLLPVLRVMERRGCPFALLDHGSIVTEAPEHWERVPPPPNGSDLSRHLHGEYGAYVFGTSVSDALPLHIAREARACGLPVVCVLDNWMNYRKRLETDGLSMLDPDVYAVMDELARGEAIRDGVTAGCLRVVGHPALANLADEFCGFSVSAVRADILKHSEWARPDRKLIVFISEPAELDQGASNLNPQFRGYTEKSVLTLLCQCLSPFHQCVQVGIVPHPRENIPELVNHWERCRGLLQGGRLAAARGREAVFIADGACGMTSLLLYEAFLLGKPVLSLQPGLCQPHLEFLRRKGMEHFIVDARVAPAAFVRWLPLLGAQEPNTAPAFHPEMDLHRRSPETLASLIEQVSREQQDRKAIN